MSTDSTSSAQAPDLYDDFDHNDGSLSAEEFRRRHNSMREGCPIAHSSRHGGFEVVTRYADVKKVLGSASVFSSADGVFIPPTGLPPVAAMEFDDPEHTKWRKLMEPPLTAGAVRSFEPTIVEIADFLIDAFAGQGSADLVRDLAEPLPSIVVGRVVGMSHEESLAGREVAASLYAALGTPSFESQLADFTAFVERLLQSRRDDPREDFLTQVADGEVDGVPIDTDGAAGLLIAYLLGGHHSTGSGIACLLRDVLTDSSLRDAVTSDPNMLVRAVDESLRLNTPLQYFARTAVEQTSLESGSIDRGSRVLVDLAAANRDSRLFDDPETFDLNRRRNPHVAFGSGIHVCLGQHLARTEIRVAVARILERLPDLRLDGDAPEAVIAGKLLTTVTLPVAFTPSASE